MLKTIMTCMKLLTWGGKVCNGTTFSLKKNREELLAVCEKCGKEHGLTHLMGERTS
jgi:hypothetical protein